MLAENRNEAIASIASCLIVKRFEAQKFSEEGMSARGQLAFSSGPHVRFRRVQILVRRAVRWSSGAFA